MAVAEFRSRAIVAIEGVEYELRRKLKDGIWQLEHRRTGRIIEHYERELLALLEQGRLRFVIKSGSTGQRIQVISLDLLPEPRAKEARKRYAYVKAVWAEKPPYFTEKTLKPIIKQTWEALGGEGRPPHHTTVWRWLKRYGVAGDDIRALVSLDHRKGNRTARYHAKVLEIAEAAIDRLYLSMQRHTIEDVVKEVDERVRYENKFLPEPLHLASPTRSLIKRLIGDIPSFDVTMARYGRQEALKKFRSVMGSDFAEYPLQRAQMDHTVIDLMVIDEETLLPLGRPTLTVCIDVASRCVLGVYVSFEPPGFVAVAECLKHAILPKESINEKYPHIKNRWEAFGVMQQIIVDNGLEFHSVNFEDSCNSLGISIEYKARKQPWGKGIVERLIGSLMRRVAHKLKGTTFSSFLDLKDYDPQKTAVVTLGDFIGHLYKFIVRPAKAGAFSGSLARRGKSQNPVAWMAAESGNRLC